MIITTLFDDKNFYRNLFTIAIPIMLQNLINSLVNMVDTVMIGRLGTTEIAAVGLGNQVFFLYTMILFGIGSGGAVFTAQFWGKRDIPGIRRTTGLSLALALAVAALFTAAAAWAGERVIGVYSRDPEVIRLGGAYLKTLAPSFAPFALSFVFTLMMRSTEKVRLPMVATLISLSLNVGLNVVLIFGLGPIPALGVVGAALATVASRLTETAILLIAAYGRSYAMAGSFKELFGFDAAFIRRFLFIALPVIVNELLWALGVTAQNIIFARTRTEAIAAFNITNTVSQLAWVFFIGVGNGAAVLIGKKIGEGSESLARSYAGRLVRFAPLAAAAIALLLVPLSLLLPYLFKVGPAVLDITSGMFVILALSYPFRAFNMSMIIGVCRAGGDTMFSVLYDIVFMWLFSLPAAAAASFIFGAPVWVVYFFVAVEDPLKMLLGLARLRSGKWLRNVTVDTP